MTPKEKAEEIMYKFIHSESQDGYNDVRDIHAAIRCALISVDEILDVIEANIYSHHYWENVKQELENL